MADGTITFNTALDNEQLEKDLKDATRKVDALKRKVETSTSARSAIEKELDQARKAAEAASRATETLRARMEELRATDPTNAEAFHAAQREVKVLEERLAKAEAHEIELAKGSESLEKKWVKANEKVKQHESELEEAKKKQRELASEVARSSKSAGSSMASGMEVANRAVDRFTSRIATMFKRVFVFGVILKGMRAVSDAITGALKENMKFSASWEGLKATVSGVAHAIAAMIGPAITGLINGAIRAIEVLASTLDSILGTNITGFIRDARATAEAAWRQGDAEEKAAKAADKQAKAVKDLAKAEKDAAKTILGFDEINAMQAETAEEVADAFDDEAGDVGDIEPATTLKPSWDAFDVGKIDKVLSEIMLILGACLLAVGAILCFSGINIPLGITLMVIGALMIYTAYKENWDELSEKTREAITAALVITGIVLIVLGQQRDLQAALGVDLVRGNLSAVLAGQAIDGGAAGERADDAHLEGFIRQSGGGQTHDHHDGEDHCDKSLVELHNRIPPK